MWFRENWAFWRLLHHCHYGRQSTATNDRVQTFSPSYRDKNRNKTNQIQGRYDHWFETPIKYQDHIFNILPQDVLGTY